jgi:hypothetical protein
MVRGCKCEPSGGDWPQNSSAARAVLETHYRGPYALAFAAETGKDEDALLQLEVRGRASDR